MKLQLVFALALALLVGLCFGQNNLVMQSSDLRVEVLGNTPKFLITPIIDGNLGTEQSFISMDEIMEVQQNTGQLGGAVINLQNISWNVQGPIITAVNETQTVLFTAAVPVTVGNETTTTNLEFDAVLFDNQAVDFVGSERVFITEDSLSFATRISNWPFVANTNMLVIRDSINQTGIEPGVNRVNNTRILIGTTDNNDQTLDHISFVDFSQTAFVDGTSNQPASVNIVQISTTNASQTEYIVNITLPHFTTTVAYRTSTGFIAEGQAGSSGSMLSINPVYIMVSLVSVIIGMYLL